MLSELCRPTTTSLLKGDVCKCFDAVTTTDKIQFTSVVLGQMHNITQIDILKLVQIKLSSWLDTKEDKSVLFYLIGVNWFFKKMCSLFPAFSL